MSEDPKDKKPDASESQGESQESSQNKDFGEGRTIILVEDDRSTSAMLRGILEGVKFNVIGAVHGQDAWDKLRPEIKPCLFICDVLMPEMDGFNLFKQLKGNPETEKIPILIISSRKAMVDTFMSMGADEFLPKPIDTAKLLEVARQLSARGEKIQEELSKKSSSQEEKSKEEKVE